MHERKRVGPGRSLFQPIEGLSTGILERRDGLDLWAGYSNDVQLDAVRQLVGLPPVEGHFSGIGSPENVENENISFVSGMSQNLVGLLPT